MRKKLLFVIDSLTIGGAEKSLVSLLNMIDHSRFEIDLMLFKKGGDLERFLPKEINLLEVPAYFESIQNIKEIGSRNLLYVYYRFKTSLNLRLNNCKKTPLHGEQVVYKSIKKVISPIEKKYDVAIAYSQGMPTYFVANKVTATKKLAWINTDYANALYNKEIDYDSYKKIDKLITVSLHNKESISNIKCDYQEKIHVIFDIIDPSLIHKMSEGTEMIEFDNSAINILTVGRLDKVKSYDLAIEVARLLKRDGYNFKWYGVGDGPERKKLQELINSYGLNEQFILLGKRINPYIYMKKCDIYVQTSLKEGFGLTVCEAKILKKPIVCTNFSTAKEIINNNVDGLLVERDICSIYHGVKKYLDNQSFREKIINELNSKATYSSVNQIEKFYELVMG